MIDESQNDSTFFDNKQEISVKYDERLGLEARRTTRERLKYVYLGNIYSKVIRVHNCVLLWSYIHDFELKDPFHSVESHSHRFTLRTAVKY